MRCSVCGTELGGRGGRCPNNGEKWHNKVHKERYQRTKWGGPLHYWDYSDRMPVILDYLFEEHNYKVGTENGVLIFERRDPSRICEFPRCKENFIPEEYGRPYFCNTHREARNA